VVIPRFDSDRSVFLSPSALPYSPSSYNLHWL
jgi:hypothetical protein